MKSSTKKGVTFGIFLMIFMMVYGFLQTDDFSKSNIIKLLAKGIISGVVAGFIFGWLMSKFGNPTKRNG
jgi:type III secretory pathway component EscT